jgi:hypothetical protein
VPVDFYQFADGNKIHFYQTPLKLCYAVTAHKSPDQILSRAAVSIMDPAFAHGAFHLALSRVRRISDLMLVGTNGFPGHGPDFYLKASFRRWIIASRSRMSSDSPKRFFIQEVDSK